MEFKKLNVRALILMALASVMLLGMLMTHLKPQAAIEQPQAQTPSLGPIINIPAPQEMSQEDTASMKEMKEEMDSDRQQQKKIKMLKLQLEQTSLQLEQEKDLSEIGKLEKDNTGIVNDSNDQGLGKYPDVRVIFIGGSTQDRQAILSINGNNYAVKEKNKPIRNMEVLAISDSSVTLHFSLPQDLKTTIEYKPE